MNKFELRLRSAATEQPGDLVVFAKDVVALLDERDARITELRAALAETKAVLRDLRQNDLPQVRADMVGLMAENKRLRSELELIRKTWKWIPIEERLPDRNVRVAVVLYPDIAIDTCYHNGVMWLDDSTIVERDGLLVKFWMPLDCLGTDESGAGNPVSKPN